MKTCEYVSCNNSAKYALHQLVGRKQVLHCCEKCAPVWVPEGHSKFYKVETIECES